MGFLDRLLGRREADQDWVAPASAPGPDRTAPAASTEDERALERYRYLVRTAPPDRIEQAHEEAFAKLTPQQRRLALEQLAREAPDEARGAGDDPRSLARTATRAELRRPGTVERAFGGMGFGGGMGGIGPMGGMGGMGGMGLGLGAGLLGSFATAFAGTLAAEALFADLADGELIDGFDHDVAADDAGDYSGSTDDVADAGDAGDAGADLGGGDFGGGDFGGGDF
jgi:hypothetical protein